MTQYDPPGFADDLNAAQKARWSEWISDQVDRCAAGEPENYDFDAPRPRFFNALTTPAGAGAVEKDITWSAFPRVVQINSSGDRERWTTADASRDVQDEYCEWSVARLADRRIQRVSFTSEGPEYWSVLASLNMDRVLDLYRTHVDPSVRKNDLLDSQGAYNPRNRWNSTTINGAMHLIQGSNSLTAEIELAAAATNVRTRNGALLTDPRDLIHCGRYGEPERHSDPKIGAEVNALARQDADITLANPVGLYIAGLSTAGWKCPDGSDPSRFWKITRGTPQKALRAVYEVPAGLDFVVGDLTINGRKIEYGAQIADYITIKLTGVAARIGASRHPALGGCKRAHQADVVADALAVSLEDVIGRRWSGHR
jgi:hypothetical protein